MPDEGMRTVLVATGADLGIALAKVFAAVFTGSSAVAAVASESLADTANDVFLLLAHHAGPAGRIVRSRPPGRAHSRHQSFLPRGAGPSSVVPASRPLWRVTR